MKTNLPMQLFEQIRFQPIWVIGNNNYTPPPYNKLKENKQDRTPLKPPKYTQANSSKTPQQLRTQCRTNWQPRALILYWHWKPAGIVFWQALRSKLSETGTFKLIPSTLALMAVQRHSAASRLVKPVSNAQQLLVGGVPNWRLMSPRRSTQTPSFNVSWGHAPAVGAGAIGVGLGLQELQALESVE